MVIYWHGFVDEVAADAHSSPDLLLVVADGFPETFFDCFSGDGKESGSKTDRF